MSMSRTIGIRHRVKKTAEGEARPTQVYMINGKKPASFDLDNEQAELDFAYGVFPTAYRAVEPGEDVSSFKPHQIEWRKLKDHSEATGLHESQVKTEDHVFYRAHRVPSAYDGLAKGDTVAMILGGSGDYLAYGLAARGREIGARVLRIPPFHFSKMRLTDDKSEDARLLAESVGTNFALFYEIGERDLALITVRELYRARIDAMKARIACEQRLYKQVEGEIFRGGLYPEGAIEAEFDRRKASDPIYQALSTEEARRNNELEKALEKLDIYRELFKPVKGLGPMASARILAAIIDFRRFIVEPDAEKMEALYVESKRLEDEVGVERTIRRLLDDGKIPAGTNRFMTLGIVARTYFQTGLIEDGKKVNQIIDLHRERAKLRHQAKQKTAAKLKKFMGAHVLPDGTFPRRRHGQVANWQPDARQALYLLVHDQFGQYQAKSGSEWSVYLKLMKAHFRQVHPEAEMVAGKKRYTDGHVHKMAIWRTATRFVEQMAYAYIEFEKNGGKGAGIHPPQKQLEEAAEVA